LFSNAQATMAIICVNIEVINLVSGQVYKRTQGGRLNLGFHRDFDIHPEGMPLHLDNLRLGMQPLKQP
jgi:hypothetical protein